jgi:UDP-N-acetylglucosamine--N-acetylmuramyl-(pentapeptide) pyrophosphoryl-undecaprenol N-acetylglucosamine transferase
MTHAVKDISSTDTLTAANSSIRVLLAAGGTGGHVYPAIAIADAIKEYAEDVTFLFVGTKDRMEWETVPRYGYNIKSVWISGFHRRLTVQNALFPLKLIVSLIQSFLILMRFRPDVVVACGGFASGPVGWVAGKMNIPVVLQEQNSFPGVTNRLLAKKASIIFTAFEDAEKHFPSEKIKMVGNPVRQTLQPKEKSEALSAFNLPKDRAVLLILGGSGGAKALNDIMEREISYLHNDLGISVLWQCGEKYLSDIKKRLNLENYPNVRLTAFIDDMPAAYGAASLVVTRAGAGTCSELMNIGKPAILVPSPNVAGNHQEKNAQSLVKQGGAQILREEDLEKEFSTQVKELIFNEEILERMSAAMKKIAKPEAAKKIAQEILTLTENSNG